MKNFSFYCAFLFMSIQIQAQLYIVETKKNFYYSSADDVFVSVDYAIIIHGPDGVTNVIEISDNQLENSELTNGCSDISSLTSASNYFTPYRISYLYQRLNEELNTIISQGYQLTNILTSVDADELGNNYFEQWHGTRYFLAVP